MEEYENIVLDAKAKWAQRWLKHTDLIATVHWPSAKPDLNPLDYKQ